MSTYISVVSHDHSELINELSCLDCLCDDFIVVVKSNTGTDCFEKLKSKTANFHWLNDDSEYGFGFGRNNNIIYTYCKRELNMKEGDYFIILNPDVIISPLMLNELLMQMQNSKIQVSAINLFKNFELTSFDNSVRNFPSLKQFVKSFLGYDNSSILDKNKMKKLCPVDWAAGSFLAFTAKHYDLLKGFDEKYFMYCEDIDICYRSSKLKVPVMYHPDIKAIHLAKHANRKIISKHFYWHLRSVLRFLLTKVGLTISKSNI